jgi:sugar O-acyltransferase (sialic acid O-acetyltransferase NeuD family)
MRRLLIIGTGGQARDVAELASAVGYRPVFVTCDRDELVAWNRQDEILHEEEAYELDQEDFAIGIGDNAARAAVAGKLRDRLRFPSLIHPDTSFGRAQRGVIEARAGVVVFAGVRFTSNISVGDFCIFNLNSTVSHDVEIGDFVSISPGASIAGNVRIGSQAMIGVGVAVNQGLDDRKLAIGAHTIVGSGAVVTGDCDANSVYVGVPARKIRSRHFGPQ